MATSAWLHRHDSNQIAVLGFPRTIAPLPSLGRWRHRHGSVHRYGSIAMARSIDMAPSPSLVFVAHRHCLSSSMYLIILAVVRTGSFLASPLISLEVICWSNGLVAPPCALTEDGNAQVKELLRPMSCRLPPSLLSMVPLRTRSLADL
ncbi:hypothetical protein CBR_g52637 [Chara braunii]|uniref:Uncharacterized protein n=1 Tax=Chara braunii TaxID=69332 RepID=A0A388MAK6_CHABU|nr:hypothetical protein CBR_g52637 [Chara braunii]|eukprot:GBG91604.1 hypothetical protein CBR_g52637 [Chara braunii]